MSSDDTSVAILDSKSPSHASIIFHETVTANNTAHRGIHPLTSLESHRTNLAPLLKRAMKALFENNGVWHKHRPDLDLICATRGPGMRTSLAVGLDMAKGLAVGLELPFVGVHHMLGHALTPRLVSAMDTSCGPRRGINESSKQSEPKFPFWSVLVSGGHTVLLTSRSVTHHEILADTVDMAVGDMLDKAARNILPSDLLAFTGSVSYGRLLEEFVFPPLPGTSDISSQLESPQRSGGDRNENPYLKSDLVSQSIKQTNSPEVGHDYHPPRTALREAQDKHLQSLYPEWYPLPIPFSKTRDKHDAPLFSFTGIGSSVSRAITDDATILERRALGRAAMQTAFEHLARRVIVALRSASEEQRPETLVLSGGVAANGFLKTVMRKSLDAAGYADLKLVHPPMKLCTDNAAMIAWAGAELYRAGWETDMSCWPVRKWSLDGGGAVEVTGNVHGGGDGQDEVEAKGVLGVDCWIKRETDIVN